MTATAKATMSFLFTDIEGSTRQWEQTTDMVDRVEHHFVVLRESVERCGGRIFAMLGDGVAAAFSSAEAAVRAAIDAQLLLRDTDVRVRMGLHTGEVEQVDDDFRGRAVNRAARIMGVGHGGQILLSDITASLVRNGPGEVGVTDLGSHRLRDLTEPEHLWQVCHSSLDSEFPALRGVDSFTNNLPAQRSSFVGRDADMQRVVELMNANRLVTLTGVGGVGKTRLAVQVAADLLTHFANVWMVELASVTDPDDVIDAIARTIGVGAAHDALGASVAVLSGERTLLLVDNCEHVVESAAEVVDALTMACPDLSVLATSREGLGVDGEHLFMVRSLDPATAALDLFSQRAVAAGARLETVERSMLEHVCRRLDGIPLALELAAARSATLGVPAVVLALDDRFSLLSGSRRRAVDRHSTMRATIDWSYRLLDYTEQRLFQWLAVFSNGFELDAAVAVAGAIGLDTDTAIGHVDSLVHKSMITADEQTYGVRYRMLETMRAFASERLDEQQERLDAMTALAEWVASITDLPYTEPTSAPVERRALRLDREADQWRDAAMVAVRLGSCDLAARLCGAPSAYFLLGRHDLAEIVRPMLDLCPDHLQRRSILAAMISSSAGSVAATELLAWTDEVEELDTLEPGGLAYIMRWLSNVWQGKFGESVDVCLRGADDPELPQSARDMLLGIAILDRFSLTDCVADLDSLVGRALETATRSPVALHRATCRLGAAWALASTDHERSLALVRLAMSDLILVPALPGLTLPGSAARLLAQLDPRTGALGLLERLNARPGRRSFVDLIPVFYGTALLARVGHPHAEPALATISRASAATYLSMMDVVDLARRAAAGSAPVSVTELETLVRIGLTDVAAGWMPS
jgi:predicted ATPase/class 3 adenylate cyclase